MNIAMFTNTYLPLVGGASISIERFRLALEARGHHCLIVAPEYVDQAADEPHVHRVSALKQINRTRFSLPLPFDLDLDSDLKAFAPDLVHAHHPFLLGDVALRAAARHDLPIVVTHHTHLYLYKQYVPANVKFLIEYINELCVGHANLCNAVIAPSVGVKRELAEAGVETPMYIIPTGVPIEEFAEGDGAKFRASIGVPQDAPLIGTVSRLDPEKNQAFLAEACLTYLMQHLEAHAVFVGDGSSRETLEELVQGSGAASRFHFAGVRKGRDLADAYHGLDVFVFASKSETQGMVITEAMAAGKPVVALHARGVEDVLRDRENGRSVAEESTEGFAEAIAWALAHREALLPAVRETARANSMGVCTRKTLNLYAGLVTEPRFRTQIEDSRWQLVSRRAQAEWDIWANRFGSLAEALLKSLRLPETSADGAEAKPEAKPIG